LIDSRVHAESTYSLVIHRLEYHVTCNMCIPHITTSDATVFYRLPGGIGTEMVLPSVESARHIVGPSTRQSAEFLRPFGRHTPRTTFAGCVLLLTYDIGADRSIRKQSIILMGRNDSWPATAGCRNSVLSVSTGKRPGRFLMENPPRG